MLEKLKNTVKENVSPENIREYTVNWSANGGINPEDHKDYLQTFADDFYEQVTRLVDSTVEVQDKNVKVGFILWLYIACSNTIIWSDFLGFTVLTN